MFKLIIEDELLHFGEANRVFQGYFDLNHIPFYHLQLKHKIKIIISSVLFLLLSLSFSYYSIECLEFITSLFDFLILSAEFLNQLFIILYLSMEFDRLLVRCDNLCKSIILLHEDISHNLINIEFIALNVSG